MTAASRLAGSLTTYVQVLVGVWKNGVTMACMMRFRRGEAGENISGC